MPERRCPLVAIRTFIEATRDSGYKSTSAAAAELIDNAFEANAKKVTIQLEESGDGPSRTKQRTITVIDDGSGMTPSVLQLALQFGGTTRFNSRAGTGRYGMGLPNGSLSQARRVEVVTWTNLRSIWTSHLDVDEIAAGDVETVPEPTRCARAALSAGARSESGTIVRLTKCDRLDYKSLKLLSKRLHTDLGKIFRKQLYAGKIITINGKPVQPIDPLFVRGGNNLTGGEVIGPPLTYEIAVPSDAEFAPTSIVTVLFSRLPIDRWHNLSNEEKNRHGISKNAGVSIVRAGREVDYGWYFMGSKRKENYDDWWRCEVSFDPDLDEVFGVTHTKQKINPTEALNGILAPDLERVAKDLNAAVRREYAEIKDRNHSEFRSLDVAQRREYLMEPLRPTHVPVATPSKPIALSLKRGLKYAIDHRSLEDLSFYAPSVSRRTLFLVLNEQHNFFQRIYGPLLSDQERPEPLLEHLQLLLLSIARAECSLTSVDDKAAAKRLREAWSNNLTAFLD